MFKKVTEVVKVANCPTCSRGAKRHSNGRKKMKDIQGVLEVYYSKHYCVYCAKNFVNPAVQTYGPLKCRSTWAFVRKALDLMNNLTLEKAAEQLKRDTGNVMSPTTLHDWKIRGDFSTFLCESDTEKKEEELT